MVIKFQIQNSNDQKRVFNFKNLNFGIVSNFVL